MSSVMFEIGPFEIKWYSVLVLTAFIIGYFIVMQRCKKEDISLTSMNDLCFYLVIFCIIGARLYYCLFNLDYYSNNILDIFKVWEGGLAIHGGIIAGLIVALYFTKKHNMPFLKILDVFAPALVLGQAIGRWGNFFNAEAYGSPTTFEYLKSINIPNFIIDGMYIDGTYYQPTFFYESMACIIIFIVLLLFRKLYKNKPGQVFSIYLICYGIVRYNIESLRQDSLMLFDFKIAQIVSIIMILIGIVLFIVKQVKNNLK